MALSQEDKLEIMQMLKEMFGTDASGAVVPVPVDDVVVEPEPAIVEDDLEGPMAGGPFPDALTGVGTLYNYVWMVSDFSANLGNRFTRSDIYELMASVISHAIDSGEEWVKGSVPSWRFTKEAFMTRASEISGDVMTTEFPVFKSAPSSNGVDYGVTAHFFNLMTTLLRRSSNQLQAQEKDRDLGPNGELLTNGECVRMAYVVLDAITDMKIVPNEKDSNFMKVRMECYKQYKAMGEGVFGPWAHPGGSTPWSWG